MLACYVKRALPAIRAQGALLHGHTAAGTP